MSFYEWLRPLLFRLDAETLHHFAIGGLEATPRLFMRMIFGSAPIAEREVFGVRFRNPIGLAAGMDKNAVALPAWEALGFGFVEVGTITAHPQPGNPRPRLFRFPEQRALINRMGFNNDGSETVARRLEDLRARGRWPCIPVGINLGKSKVTPIEEAANDYLASFKRLLPFGDYFVINVSSPNTPGLRELQEIGRLQKIIGTLREHAASKPILIKISPDLADTQAAEIAALAEQEGIAGLIATNTTLDHSSIPPARDQQGGLSGALLTSRSTQLLRFLRTQCRLPIMGSGGVMDADSAQEKFKAGAELVQIYTGLIYRGPALIREIRPPLSGAIHPD